MAQTSLLGWANSIRITMANDPGRKLFQEQVQAHGFSFLDDYLEDILSGAKQDPLIELVKTPGRKKAISRKPKLASKLTQVVALSLEVEGSDGMGESVAPSNQFTQALLGVKGRNSEKEPSESVTVSIRSEEKITSNASSTHTPPLELSVINEDDEGMERSITSIQPANPPRSETGGQGMAMPPQAPPQGVRLPVAHSIPLDSMRQSLNSSPMEVVCPTLEPPHETKEAAVIDITIPLHDSETKPSSPGLSARKSVLTTLPTLPEPIPLRKSMRSIKDTPMGGALIGTATPGNTAIGKRTSWLMKAREAKAMEGIPRKPVIIDLSTASHTLAGAKRKSEEVIDPTGNGQNERNPKVSKQRKDETAPTKSASPSIPKSNPELTKENLPLPNQEGMLNLLKKKAQGFEARNDKLSDKVLRDAAAALAEARAQAEVRIAERNHQEVAPTTNSTPDVVVGMLVDQVPAEGERRFSISDLFPSDGKIKDKSKAPRGLPKLVAPPPAPDYNKISSSNNESTSTTPPHSPPAGVAMTVKAVPVFNKPPPVFVPPLSNPRPLPTPPALKETTFSFIPPSGAFTKPAPISLGISPQFGSPLSDKPRANALSAQSTLETVQSDDIFDDRGNTEAWVPSTQDTEYSSAFGTQPAVSGQPGALDEDDSWPIDEKLSHGGHWPFGGQSKEDSMTWSTLPSQSQRVDTGPVSRGGKNQDDDQASKAQPEPISGGLDGDDMEIENEDFNTGVEEINTDHELEDLILSGTRATAASIELEDNESQASLVSSASSQSQVGFFGQASKFLSSALGTSKKGKPEVKKVIQMAAVAAKKQQEEDDKRAARLKEMENRRQLAMQRKAEEEKARQQEQERKVKEEVERRKREREELVEKKPLKPFVASASSKKDEEAAKKRKVDHDKAEKKPDPKKHTPLNKTGFKPTSKQVSALSSSAVYNTSQSSQSTIPATAIKVNEKTSKVPTAIPTKGKSKQKLLHQGEDDHTQPSQIIQTQMAARAKAAMQTEARVPSESIELPEVNSEYSDSEDEDRPRTFNPPDWAQSPELRQALQAQSTINPDDIFGAIRPLRMEEMFKARTSRFRARTSSANWSGTDRLTVEEEREYARRMGFK